MLSEIADEARIVRALTQKNRFNEWQKWECAMSADLSWQQLLHKQSDSYLHFLLNSTDDSLPTPSVLKCWKQTSASDGKCPLAATMQALSDTSCVAVRLPTETAKRHPKSCITWRHDSILLAIHNAVKEQVDNTNCADPAETVNHDHIQNPLRTSFKSVSFLRGDSEDKASCIFCYWPQS